MAEGWKQIWSDMKNAVRGAPPVAAEEGAAGEEHARVQDLTPRLAADEPRLDAAPTAETMGTDTLVARESMSDAFDDRAPRATSASDEAAPDAERPDAALETLAPGLVEPAPVTWRDRGRRFASIGGMIALALGMIAILAWPRLAPSVEALLAPQAPAPDIVATFNGGQITRDQLAAHLELLVPEHDRPAMYTLENLRMLVAEMMEDELMRRWAAERKVDTDETFADTMQHISENLNLDSLHTQLHQNDIPVQESEIQAYYQANQAQFGGQTLDEVRQEIRDILTSQREPEFVKQYIERLRANASITKDLALLETPELTQDELRRYYDANREQFKLPAQVVVDELEIPIEDDEADARQRANAALLKLRAGATMIEASQAITGTEIYTATNVISGTRSAEWTAAVANLQVGELSDVLNDEDVFSIVHLGASQPERIPALEEAREQVLVGARKQKAAEWFQSNGDKTLFTIKGRRYTLGQFYKEYQELPPDVQATYAGVAGLRNLAERLIERLLVVEDSYDRLLDVENKEELEQTRLDVLKQMFHQENVDDKVKVTDEQVKAFYEEHQARFTLPPRARIRYLRIGLGQTPDDEKRAQDKADEAYRKLALGPFQQGADFAAIVREYSEDPESAAKGGELDGWVGESLDALTDLTEHPFHQQVLALQKDEISPPFVYGDSLYIVQVLERSEPQPTTLEQATPLIQDALTDQQHDELLVKLSAQLREQAQLVIYDAVLREIIAAQLPSSTATP